MLRTFPEPESSRLRLGAVRYSERLPPQRRLRTPLWQGQALHVRSPAGVANAVVGGWSLNWSATLQGGQPITLPCPRAQPAGRVATICLSGPEPENRVAYRLERAVELLGNPAAFSQPCMLVAGVADPTSVAGCVPLTGLVFLGGGSDADSGTRFHRLDFSLFKDFQLTERFRCSSVRSSSTFSTIRTSTLRDLGVTVLWRSRRDQLSPARTLARSDLLAMLRTIRDRSSSL